MAASLGDLRDALTSTLHAALPAVTVHAYPVDNIDGTTIIVAGFSVDPGSFGDTTARVEAELLLFVSRKGRQTP